MAGRNGFGEHRGRRGEQWRKVRAEVLAEYAGRCHICGCGGAGEVDHVVSRKVWIQLGNDPLDRSNLRPAHGHRSQCTTHGACNQVKGSRARHGTQANGPDRSRFVSRRW
jgi:5-methylcytosine-specific restriction endonuclease McrA